MNGKYRLLILQLYTWVATVMFGGVLFDMLYANLLKNVIGSAASEVIFSDISDTLLLTSFIMAIIALGAIISSWRSAPVRNMLIASIVVFLFEFFGPISLSFFKELSTPSWIRLFPSGVASILAYIGLYKYYR